MATLLLDHSVSLVARADLLAANGRCDQRRPAPRGLAYAHLQRRIASLGMRVHAVRASGFLLEVGGCRPHTPCRSDRRQEHAASAQPWPERGTRSHIGVHQRDMGA